MTGTTPSGGAPSATSAPAPSASPAPAAAPPAPGPSSAPSPAPSGTPPGSSSAQVQEPGAREAFVFDPFGPAEPPAAPPAAEPAQAAPPGAPPASAPAGPAPGAPSSPPSTEAALAEIVNQNREVLERIANGQPAPAAPAQAPSQQDDTPAYAFNVPDPIMAAMASEDPAVRRQGVNTLVQGLGRAIHRTIVTQMRGEFMQVMQNYVANAQQHQQTVAEIKRDYFSAYPQHNHPQLAPIIRQISVDVAGEWRSQKWDAKMRDEVGSRVERFLAQFRAAPAASPAPAAPPMQTPPGARPAPSNLPQDQQEMIDLLH